MTDQMKSAAQLLGRKGGSVNSPSQNAARAVNARKGGRPRVICPRCHSRNTMGPEVACAKGAYRFCTKCDTNVIVR